MIPDPWRKRKQCSPSRRSFQVEQPQAAPNGCSRVTNHETRFLCFPTHDFPAFPTISRPPPVKGPRAVRSPLSCALWSGMARLWRGMGALWSPSPCPRAVRCEIPAMWTKSRFPQENARSAAFAAAPFALGAQPAEVDANGHTAPGSAAKSPLIRVHSWWMNPC